MPERITPEGQIGYRQASGSRKRCLSPGAPRQLCSAALTPAGQGATRMSPIPFLPKCTNLLVPGMLWAHLRSWGSLLRLCVVGRSVVNVTRLASPIVEGVNARNRREKGRQRHSNITPVRRNDRSRAKIGSRREPSHNRSKTDRGVVPPTLLLKQLLPIQ